MIEEVWNAKNLDVLDELYQPDARIYLSTEVIVGSERLRDEFIRPTQEAFPDMIHTIQDIVADDDKVAMRYKGEGSHSKEFSGKSATFKTLRYEGVILFRMREGRVSEVWNHSNWSERFEAL